MAQQSPAARPERQHLRRLERLYPRPPILLVTACTEARRPALTEGGLAAEVTASLSAAARNAGWHIGRYVVMPDHVHFFAAPGGEAQPLSRLVGTWKRWTTRAAWRLGHTGRLWQREFHDHVLRSEEQYEAKWLYVVQNPVRAGLCAQADEWPHQGEFEAL